MITAIGQTGLALSIAIITAVGVVVAAIFGLAGVRQTAKVTAETTMRSDLLKERQELRAERDELIERVDELERIQDEDHRTMRAQGRLIDQQEERILNQNRTIGGQGQRITRLEATLRRHKITVPNGAGDTDPNLTRPS